MSRVVTVKVTPRASHNQLVVGDDGTLLARVTVPPSENAANEATKRLLAQHFHIANSLIVLIRGKKSRVKQFRIETTD